MFRGMETSPQELKALSEALQRSMLQILELDPANGWYWITEAQMRALHLQIESGANTGNGFI